MSAESRNGGSGQAPTGATGAPVTGRLGPRRSLPALGGLGIVIAAVVVVALVARPNPGGGSPASPSPAASDAAVSTPAEPTPRPPSEAPQATEPGDGLFVEPNVVDRPGVPAALYDKYWLAGGQVGQVGTTARLVKPDNEGILGVDAGRVATVVFDPVTEEPKVGPSGVAITVRDIRTGTTLRTVDSPILPTYGLVTGSLLFWTGWTLPRDPISPLDGGVWVIDLADPAAVPTAIIEPSDLSATYGPDARRSLLRLSDRGRAVTSTVVGGTGRATDVIDVPSQALRLTIADEIAYQVAAGAALVARPDRLALLDLETGREIGPGVEKDLTYFSLVGDDKVFASFARGRDFVVVAIKLDSGEVREVLVQRASGLQLHPELSTPDVLVLLPDDDPAYDPQGRVQVPVTLLDPVTGVLRAEAFTIGSP